MERCVRVMWSSDAAGRRFLRAATVLARVHVRTASVSTSYACVGARMASRRREFTYALVAPSATR